MIRASISRWPWYGSTRFAGFVLGDGVEGEIAARQILLQAHRCIGMEHEAFVTGCGFAFGARQRIFLAGFRMQEDRKVRADRLEAAANMLSGVSPTTT